MSEPREDVEALREGIGIPHGSRIKADAHIALDRLLARLEQLEKELEAERERDEQRDASHDFLAQAKFQRERAEDAEAEADARLAEKRELERALRQIADSDPYDADSYALTWVARAALGEPQPDPPLYDNRETAY